MEQERSDDDSFLSKTVNAMVFGGIIAGLTFALISPVAMPWITTKQAETGILTDEPDIVVNLDKYPAGEIDRGENSTYIIEVRNPNKRIAEEVRLTFYFLGCAKDRGFRAENGRTFANPGLKFGNTSHCTETVYIPNLAKGEEIALEYHVRHEIKRAPVAGLVIGPDHEFAYREEYQWQLNGITFTETEITRMNASYEKEYK